MEKFVKEHVPNLQKKLDIKNVNAVPKIEKVVISIGIGSLVTRKGQKDFEEFESNLIKITGQKPRLVKSKKSISNFKLREDMPVMMQSTLRRQKAHDFLDRLNKLVLPRVRDFDGLSAKSFDHQGNYNVGLKDYSIFPELGLEDATIPMGLQINVVTTGDAEQTRALLEELGFIFK